jgi:G:T-mismatch repair DNA endonuclease (very short patch repair protein)
LSESEKLQWKPARGNRSWADVHKGDIRKYNTLRCVGFEVLVVWDFEDEEQIVEKILDFLND